MAKKAEPARRFRFLQERPERFWREIISRRFIVTVVGLIVLSNWLGHIWVFQYAGLAAMDTFAKVQPVHTAKVCRIVSIPEEDYSNPKIFNGQSPLDPERLSIAIERVLRLHPAVLAIDIDTSSPRMNHLVVPNTKIPIVWARDAQPKGDSLVARPVLGNNDADPPYWGFSLFPRNTDWSVRNYPRSFRIGTRNWPSFHWAIARAYCIQSASNARCGEIMERDSSPRIGELSVPVFHFAYSFPTIPLRDLWVANSFAPENILNGRIAILGGYYSSSDVQPTPFGPMAGAELVASAVEGELNPIQPRSMDFLGRICWKVVLAILIAWLHYRLRPRYALLATVVLVSAIVLMGSFIAFRISAYRADFLPFLLGIWIEQLFESAELSQRQSQS